MPLRVRLVAASTLLVAIGLAISGFVAATTLRGYLYDRVDDQLQQASLRYIGPGFGAPSLDPDHDEGGPHRVDAGPTQYYAGYLSSDGVLQSVRAPDVGAGDSEPQLPRMTAAQAVAVAGKPFTVSGQDDGSSWRVVARPLPNSAGTVLVALSLSDVSHTVSRLMLLELVIGLTVVVVLGAAGYF